MINEEDIKVGNFVTSCETICIHDAENGVYKHTLPSGIVYYRNSSEAAIFKITSADDGVSIVPICEIKSFPGIDFRGFAVCRDIFKKDFTLVKLSLNLENSIDMEYTRNKEMKREGTSEQVNHPSHYSWLKELCGIEPMDICRHLDFNCGQVVKYILRKGKKEMNLTERQQRVQDLKKAKTYLEDEIKLIEDGKDGI